MIVLVFTKSFTLINLSICNIINYTLLLSYIIQGKDRTNISVLNRMIFVSLNTTGATSGTESANFFEVAEFKLGF